jgi:hypothetical protein
MYGRYKDDLKLWVILLSFREHSAFLLEGSWARSDSFNPVRIETECKSPSFNPFPRVGLFPVYPFS